MDFTFTTQEVISIGAVLVFVGGQLWSVRQMNQRFDRLDQKDTEHDNKISELDKRLAVAETNIENMNGWMQQMRDQINAIYKQLVGGKI